MADPLFGDFFQRPFNTPLQNEEFRVLARIFSEVEDEDLDEDEYVS